MPNIADEFYKEVHNSVEVLTDMSADDLALWLRIMAAIVAVDVIEVDRDDVTIQWMRDYAPRALELAEPYIIWI